MRLEKPPASASISSVLRVRKTPVELVAKNVSHSLAKPQMASSRPRSVSVDTSSTGSSTSMPNTFSPGLSAACLSRAALHEARYLSTTSYAASGVTLAWNGSASEALLRRLFTCSSKSAIWDSRLDFIPIFAY